MEFGFLLTKEKSEPKKKSKINLRKKNERERRTKLSKKIEKKSRVPLQEYSLRNKLKKTLQIAETLQGGK